MSEHEPKWRRSETISFSTLVIVASWIIWASQHVQTWNVVADPRKGNDALDTRITVVETRDKDFQEQVLRELNAIYKKVK